MQGIFTGLRVGVVDEGGGPAAIGTVVGDVRDFLPSSATRKFRNIPVALLVCMDDRGTSNQDGGERAEVFTGRYRNRIVGSERLFLLDGQFKNEPKHFSDLPEDVYVYTLETIKLSNGTTLNRSETGRLLCRSENMATVQWHFRTHNFNLLDIPHVESLLSGGADLTNICQVPIQTLAWCRGSMLLVQKSCRWPRYSSGSRKQYQTDDLVVIHGGRHLKLVDMLGNNRSISEGIIARVLPFPEGEESARHIRVRIVAVADLDLLDTVATVPLEIVTPFHAGDLLFERKKKVEIVADIDFRNQALKGKIATVVLPTDGDGDVGLEFQEDLKAGSLDGAGKQGHCLYVPTSALKASE